MRRLALALLSAGWATLAPAQTADTPANTNTDPAQTQTPAVDAVAATRAAALDLLGAVDLLAEAREAPDQIAALTRTIAAHEDALSALRAGLGALDGQEAALAATVARQAETLSRLTGALLAAGAIEGPALLVHPQGPLGTARAGMLLGDLTPRLQVRTAALRDELAALQALRETRDTALSALDRGRATLTQARAALTDAAATARADAAPVGQDEAMLLALLESAQTLEILSAGLAGLVPGSPAPAPDLAARLDARSGGLPLPVRGRLLQRSVPLPGGASRPVLILATEPGALVVSPVAATLRYTGPLDDYGNVILLEPGEGYLLLMAGLDIVYAGTGAQVAPGAPLGLMAGARPPGQGGPGGAGAGDGAVPDTALRFYLELRRAGQPIDPGDWFDLTGLEP